MSGSDGVPPVLLRFLSSLRVPTGGRLAEYLGGFDELMNGVAVEPVNESVHVIEEYGDWIVRASVFRPFGPGPFPMVLYLHGGAWVVGNHLSHRGVARELANAGFLVVVPDYRRAPKHRFPAALNDAILALRWCLKAAEDLDGNPARLVVAGDSAGANLAAAAVTSAGVPVSGLALLCGVFDYESAMPVLSGLIGDGDVGYVANEVLPQLRRDPRLSPLYATAGWPRNVYIGVGDHDPLVSQSRQLHERLTKLGVTNSLHVFSDLPHAYLQLPMAAGYAEAMGALLSFLRDSTNYAHQWD